MALAARRIGAESSATRALILEAAERLIREEGYGAVSTRRVATEAGLKPSLVHYYFTTTDDLWLALFRRGAEQSDAMLDEALAAPDPLHALWEFFADTSRTGITLEFMALANHKQAIRAEMVAHSDRMRERQVEVLTRLLGERIAGAEGCPPSGLSLVLAGIGRALVMEGALGVDGGHAEARAYVEKWIEQLTGGENAEADA
jgi:AcrR family transcriptional regulator